MLFRSRCSANPTVVWLLIELIIDPGGLGSGRTGRRRASPIAAMVNAVPREVPVEGSEIGTSRNFARAEMQRLHPRCESCRPAICEGCFYNGPLSVCTAFLNEEE